MSSGRLPVTASEGSLGDSTRTYGGRMTSGKHRKRRARQRAARTGESYTTALHHVRSRQEGHMSSSAPSSPTKLLASWSFCGKPNTEVKKLIAGPGIYICDECVGLCQDIISAETSADDAAAQRAAFEDRPAPEILKLLPALARTVDSVESDLRRWVQKLRAGGTPWPEIASRLGIDPEVAEARFERQ